MKELFHVLNPVMASLSLMEAINSDDSFLYGLALFLTLLTFYDLLEYHK